MKQKLEQLQSCLQKMDTAMTGLLELTTQMGKWQDLLAEGHAALIRLYLILSDERHEAGKRVLRMFKPLDSQGTVIHTKDKVSFADGTNAVVVAIIDLDNVHVIPTEGELRSVEPASLTVVDSFIGKLQACNSEAELLAILEAAKMNVKVETEKKAPRERSTKSAKPALEASDI